MDDPDLEGRVVDTATTKLLWPFVALLWYEYMQTNAERTTVPMLDLSLHLDHQILDFSVFCDKILTASVCISTYQPRYATYKVHRRVIVRYVRVLRTKGLP